MTVTNTAPPVVTGQAQRGQTLSTTNGTWTFSLDYLTYAYQWERCDVNGDNCVDIGGATSSTYVLQSADVSHRIRSEVTATEHSGATVLPATPGNALTVIATATPGDTVLLTGGDHPYFTLNTSFAEPRVTVTCDAGVDVVGIDTGGQDGYIFDTCRFVRAADFSDFNNSTFYLHGTSSRIRAINCYFEGGNITVKMYGGGVGGLDGIEILDSEITGGGEDLMHLNGVQNSLIDHNYFHDPVFSSGAHQDCIQSAAYGCDNVTISRNYMTGTGVSGGNSQCCQLGEFRDGLVVNNLMAHWNGGRAINVSHSSRNIKIVNNTVQDLPTNVNFPSIALDNGGTGPVTGMQIWNNIVQAIYTAASSQYTLIDTNWITDQVANGGNTSGTNSQTGAPGFVDTVNYELTGGAPARNYGIVRSGTPTVDLDGNARSATAPVVLGCRV